MAKKTAAKTKKKSAKKSTRKSPRKAHDETGRLLAVLVAPGEDPEELRNWAESSLSENPDVLFIGVDGGLDVLLESGLPAGVAIGDWDSLRSKNALKEVSHVTLTSEKDRSDLFYALEFAAALGATDVVAYGFQGGRLDHEIGVYHDLREGLKYFEGIVWVGERAEAWLIEAGEMAIEFRSGEAFSVYALSDKSTGVTLKNAKYELKSAALPRSTLGLSNVARGTVSVKVKKGGVMVIQAASETSDRS